MRVLQIAPSWFPVPPTGYGGIEWVVSSLADGLTALGHDVTLVANGDSETSADLVSAFDGSTPQRLGDVWMDATHAVTAYLHANDVDVIHDHTGVIGPAIAAAGGLRTPVVNTLHGPCPIRPTLPGAVTARAAPAGRRRCRPPGDTRSFRS